MSLERHSLFKSHRQSRWFTENLQLEVGSRNSDNEIRKNAEKQATQLADPVVEGAVDYATGKVLSGVVGLRGAKRGLSKTKTALTAENKTGTLANKLHDFEERVGEFVNKHVLSRNKTKAAEEATGGISATSTFGKNPSFFKSEKTWTAPGKGTSIQYKVYQQEIDWNLKVKDGLTNLDLAKKGKAPYVMKDGQLQQIQLHHSRQNAQGPLFETSRSTHLDTKSGQGREALHPYGQEQHPNFPVDRPLFKKDVNQYWIDRAKGVNQ